MADNKITIFRLPLLAICKVLEFYGPQEIIQLSLCSKRSLRITKKCWTKKGKIEAELFVEIIPKVILYFYDTNFYYRFDMLEEEDLKDQQVHNIRVGDAVVPSIHKDTETLFFWRDKIRGIEHIVRYIKYLFDVPITSIELMSEECQNQFIDTLDCITNIQESVEDCTLDTADPNDECLTHLLDNCKITGTLWIFGGLSSRFRHNWNVNVDSLRLPKDTYLTFENLVNMDCERVDVSYSNLTSEDANRFLKHWQSGGSSRLKHVSIMMNTIHPDIVKSGIETVTQPKTLYSSHYIRPNMGCVEFYIQRNDGTIGTCLLTQKFFDFGLERLEVFSD